MPDDSYRAIPELAKPAILAIPANSKIPERHPQRSTPSDYDAYFHLVRTGSDLSQWTQSCLRVLGRQLSELPETALSAEDEIRIITGANKVLQKLLEKWIEIGCSDKNGGEQCPTPATNP